MKRNIYIVFFIFLLSFIVGCKKDNVKVQNFTVDSESIFKGTTTIILTVEYSYPTILEEVEGYISDNTNMNNAFIVHGEITENVITIIFKGLHANTTYYYNYGYSNGIDNLIKTEIKSLTTNDYSEPIISTNNVTSITYSSAICGGNILDDGGSEVITKGVCWSLNPYPTIECSHTTDGSGTSSFNSCMVDLSSYTTYYIRSYAINSVGINYGEQKIFKTKYHAPNGAIAGLYSVSTNKKVCFSQGNLQYQASTNTWRFAENQWDYVGTQTPDSFGNYGGTINGSDNSSISSTYDGWIDLYGWGTSGYNHGGVCYQPYSTSSNDSDYYVYGSYTYNLNDQSGKADWGYNAISNGGSVQNKWYTLSSDEWYYVFNNRNTSSGIRFARAQVNGINGVVLLPDDWDDSYYSLKSTNINGAKFTSNIISSVTWINALESNGAVFLPLAGCRYINTVSVVGSNGRYWSSTHYSLYGNNINTAHLVYIWDNGLQVGHVMDRHMGHSVRLVCDAE